ncbi:nicotinamide/nicotinic acid mononucleotide adenylyltransferase 2 [Anaeramoeba ignava]|uniref:Nicotinamide/nicotinic acid mononucleotide adenylyltransferase 2 n=1 Tax=Anaeramoeba ignava TaxID=1746090 RepID=A0A9Q0L5V8_ANAIG|nr:nicotinamide/nicotinic acid mononucleotide adenylyltransferase 2 [Anaeramoeba ignava]
MENKMKENSFNLSQKLIDKFTDINDSRRKIVLLCTGSFNPIHKMHIIQFQLAKEYLESEFNYNIVGAIISPSHDKYLKRKLGDEAIPFQERVLMCKKAILEEKLENWMIIDEWEGNQDEFLDFFEIIQIVQNRISKNFPNSKIDVIYVCGMDHFLRYKCYERTGYAVVERIGFSLEDSKFKTDQNRDIYFFKNTKKGFSMSSSKIRELRDKGESFDELTYKSVIERLNEIGWNQ